MSSRPECPNCGDRSCNGCKPAPMTSEQKMQAIVEAAGECWHKYDTIAYFDMFNCIGETLMTIHHKCNCGEVTSDHEYLNLEGENRTGVIPQFTHPSPTDLNELFRLADKLGFTHIYHYIKSNACMINKGDVLGTFTGYSNIPAEALLNALYGAIKESQ